jgi:ribosomal protein S24E
MNFEVISERENPLFKRKEILASIDYQGGSTPSKADLQKALAEQFKVAIDSVEITKVLSETGLTRGRAWIKVWHEKKVPIYAEIKKEKKGAEEAQEAPKEEAK